MHPLPVARMGVTTAQVYHVAVVHNKQNMW